MKPVDMAQGCECFRYCFVALAPLARSSSCEVCRYDRVRMGIISNAIPDSRGSRIHPAHADACKTDLGRMSSCPSDPRQVGPTFVARTNRQR